MAAAAEERAAESQKAPRYDVFLRHPWLKWLVGVLACLLVSWLAYPAVKVFDATRMPASAFYGSWASREGYSLVLSEGSGRFYVSSFAGDHAWSYDAGLFTFSGDSASFAVRGFSDGLLYSYSDRVFYVREAAA